MTIIFMHHTDANDRPCSLSFRCKKANRRRCNRVVEGGERGSARNPVRSVGEAAAISFQCRDSLNRLHKTPELFLITIVPFAAVHCVGVCADAMDLLRW